MAIGRTNAVGTAMNFNVVAGTSSPSSPKENTIWVKTSTVAAVSFGPSAMPSYSATANSVYIGYAPTSSSTSSGNRLSFIKQKGNISSVPGELLSCYQYQSYTWKKVYAYIYKSGSWVQFSSEFSATITVTYPSGSTVTCSDGSTTLTASSTSGSYTFDVPNTGTWTVKAVSGSNSASEAVSITYSGQSASVTLTYFDGYYYENGNEWSNVTGGWIAETKKYGTTGSTTITPILTKASDHMEFDLVRSAGDSGGYGATLRTQNAVDLTNVNTLYFDVEGDGSYKQYWLGAIQENGSEFAASIKKGAMGTFTINRSAYSLDVSSLNGKHWIAIAIYSANSEAGALDIYNVYGK